MTRELKKRHPHWLPFPLGRTGVAEISVSQEDLFRKGKVMQFFSHQGYGFVHPDRGDDIFFRLTELDLIGPKNDKRYLKVGARVGFDVSQASNGLHIRILKIY